MSGKIGKYQTPRNDFYFDFGDVENIPPVINTLEKMKKNISEASPCCCLNFTQAGMYNRYMQIEL